MERPSIMQRLLQRIEHEACMRRARGPPADKRRHASSSLAASGGHETRRACAACSTTFITVVAVQINRVNSGAPLFPTPASSEHPAGLSCAAERETLTLHFWTTLPNCTPNHSILAPALGFPFFHSLVVGYSELPG